MGLLSNVGLVVFGVMLVALLLVVGGFATSVLLRARGPTLRDRRLLSGGHRWVEGFDMLALADLAKPRDFCTLPIWGITGLPASIVLRLVQYLGGFATKNTFCAVVAKVQKSFLA